MPEPLEAHVRDTDAFAIHMERDPLLRSTITAVAVFDRAPDWDLLVERVDRATRVEPSFRQRVVPSPFGLAPPRWVLDPDFDLSWHLRRVAAPEPRTLHAVLAMARVAGMAAFDPARPLWEFTLVDGLEDGRAALVMKVHHALTDGIGGIQLAAHVVDLEREPDTLGPMPPEPSAAPHGLVERVGEAIGFDLARWRAAGGTLNDAFVAAVAGGLRRYHRAHDAGVESLRVTMPISLRTDDDPAGGNRVTLVRFEVPVALEDPVERMTAVGRTAARLRRERALPFSEAVAGVLNLLPTSITGGMLKHIDFLASNVPGFPVPVHVGGARLEAFYPFGPTIGSSANVTLMSYCDTCHIGVNTDAGAVPDPAVFLRCLSEGFEEVLTAGRATAGST